MSGRAVTPATEVLGGPGTVTVIAGLTFAISDERGDARGAHDGLIAADVRHLSRLELLVDGAPLLHLGAGVIGAGAVRFRAYVPRPGAGPDATIEVSRERRVMPGGLREEVEITSWDHGPVDLRLTLRAEADFADIFEVRQASGPAVRRARSPSGDADHVRFDDPDGGRATVMALEPPADDWEAGDRHWDARVVRGSPWRLRIDVEAVGGRSPDPTMAPEQPGAAASAEVVATPEGLARAVERSLADLDRLTLRDRLDPRRRVLAAGIPWYVALFGRDAIVSSIQARAFEPWRMVDTLRALAARQGRVHDPGNEEAPGKILHEVRFSERAWLGEGTTGGARPYYGTIDATPLFIILAGVARRWGAPRDELAGLLPALRAAMGWIRGGGDPDGDGFLEYAPSRPPLPGQPGMEGLVGRDPVVRRHVRRGSGRAGRGAGLRVPSAPRAGGPSRVAG